MSEHRWPSCKCRDGRILTGRFESVLHEDLLLASYNAVDDKVLPDHFIQRLVRKEQQMFAETILS
jgi:hypothetical protein